MLFSCAAHLDASVANLRGRATASAPALFRATIIRKLRAWARAQAPNRARSRPNISQSTLANIQKRRFPSLSLEELLRLADRVGLEPKLVLGRKTKYRRKPSGQLSWPETPLTLLQAALLSVPPKSQIKAVQGSAPDRELDAMVSAMQTPAHSRAMRELETLPLREILQRGAALADPPTKPRKRQSGPT